MKIIRKIIEQFEQKLKKNQKSNANVYIVISSFKSYYKNMGKFFFCNALIFSVKPSKENQSTVCFLSQNEGISFATLYGGSKSRLKSLVSPWNSGTIYLSKSNTGSFFKINDFEPLKYHLSFREDIYKFLAASMAAEIVINTNCSASYEKSWYLLNGFLDGLDLCREKKQSELGLYRFLWKYLDLSGLKPETSFCSYCTKDFNTKSQNDNFSFFLKNEQNIVCSECFFHEFPEERDFIPIENKTLNYLNAITELKPEETRKIFLEEKNIQEIKHLIFYLIENINQKPLKTLETGKGIL